ncbi:putative glycosyltransferase [Mycobacteroides abscessus subsp. abscessus]|nr:putative glycosyltransferase [Mycobacteroides abscessus subsp. abscessus]
MSTTTSLPTADVIICTHSLQRWGLLSRAVESVLAQPVLPQQLIIAVDHNDELVERCRREWGADNQYSPVRIIAVPNQFAGRKGSTINTALLHTQSEVIVFLDDDAEASPDWLERILAVYATRPNVVAVGCAPLPNYEGPRPPWFPPEFDWVLGCHYQSLPNELAPTNRLIGTCLSARRDAVLDIGGWHQDDHDDMDVSERLTHRFGPSNVLYEPEATVRHFVPAERLTWSYFWRRCYYTNQRKPTVLADMGGAANMRAEFRFVWNVLKTIPSAIGSAVIGRPQRLIQTLTSIIGIVLAGSGYAIAKARFVLGRRVEPVGKVQNRTTAHGAERLTKGLSPEDVERARALAPPAADA